MEIAADGIMLHLLIYNASKAPELFEKSAQVYARFVDAEVAKHHQYIMDLQLEDLDFYRKA